MSRFQIDTAEDVYQFVQRLKLNCRSEDTKLYKELENALHLGSSGLEILGAIRQTIVRNRNIIERLLGSTGQDMTDAVIAFIDNAFGRRY